MSAETRRQAAQKLAEEQAELDRLEALYLARIKAGGEDAQKAVEEMDALRAARYAEEMEFDRISRERRAQQQKELEETEASIREAAITLAKTKDSLYTCCG